MAIYAIQNPVYQPAMRVILSITNSFPAVVVTSVDGVVPADHDYITGTIVRLDIPTGFGMTQADQLTGTIEVLSLTSFAIDIDTTLFDVFAMPAAWPFSQQQAQVVPIGEINEILTASTVNVL